MSPRKDPAPRGTEQVRRALSPVELAAAALADKTAVRDDAKAQLAEATRQHVAAEVEHDRAKARHDTAIRAAATVDKADATALAAATVAESTAASELRVAEFRLGGARRAQEATVARVASAETAVADAEREQEVATLVAGLTDGSRAALFDEAAQAFVAGVRRLGAIALSVRQRVGGDAKLAERARSLGADVAIPDGTEAAGRLAAALLASGGTLATANVHELRHPFEAISTDRDRDGIAMLTKLVALTVASFAQAQRNRDNGTPARGRYELEQAAEVFSRSPDRLTAIRELEALDSATEARLAAKRQREHEGRIIAARTATRVAALPQRENSQIVPPAPPTEIARRHLPRPDIGGEEWSAGDDFSQDVPKVG